MCYTSWVWNHCSLVSALTCPNVKGGTLYTLQCVPSCIVRNNLTPMPPDQAICPWTFAVAGLKPDITESGFPVFQWVHYIVHSTRLPAEGGNAWFWIQTIITPAFVKQGLNFTIKYPSRAWMRRFFFKIFLYRLRQFMRTLSTCWKQHWYLWNSPCLQPQATPDRASSSDKSGVRTSGKDTSRVKATCRLSWLHFVKIPGRWQRFHAAVIDLVLRRWKMHPTEFTFLPH